MLCERLPSILLWHPLVRSACVGLETLQHVIVREKVGPISQQIQVAFFGGVHILNQLYKEVSVDVNLDWQLGHWGFQQSSFDPVQALGLRIAISSAITCCEKDQQWQHGVSLLFNMAGNRNAPNVVSCSEIYCRVL